MSQDELQCLLVFILPWVGLPIGAVGAYFRQTYRDQRLRPARAAKNARQLLIGSIPGGRLAQRHGTTNSTPFH